MAARVTTASETVACERATIQLGTPSRLLMQRAGVAAATEIAARFQGARSALIFTGPGNNGGDGWVVAGELARAGWTVGVAEVGQARTDEARAARDLALGEARVSVTGFPHWPRSHEGTEKGEKLVIDALLGTGATGAPRGAVAEAIAEINRMGSAGSAVIALDLPSGLDATTGDHELCVDAHLTLSFGSFKRGHLLARDVCGEIVVLEIGLVADAADDAPPIVVDAAWVRGRVPPIPPDAHKGTRKRLAIVGSGKGMAGAGILAGEGALRSGIGLLRIVAAPESVIAVHAGIPAAIVQEWPQSPDELALLVQSADAIAIGPGLGQTSAARDLVERVLLAWSGPVVLDADALNVFAGDLPALESLLRGRPVVITPHPAEMGRLMGVSAAEVAAARFEIGLECAKQIGASVLLKGVPTVISSPTGERLVSASGTAALATGGSGDVLTGMIATLLAQTSSGPVRSGASPTGTRQAGAHEAAACAAFIHGRAAELCGVVRGTTLDDILRMLPAAWNESPTPLREGVLAHLDAIP